MSKRYAAIWFPHLTTDWLAARRPVVKNRPFAFAAPEHGRMVITAASPAAVAQGIRAGMVVADARSFLPYLQVFEDQPGLSGKLLEALGRWCFRYTPVVALDYPGGLILDTSGCTHLWGGEEAYLKAILISLKNKGYAARMAIADTIGAAWAVARFGQTPAIIENGDQARTLLSLPPASLRLEPATVERLQKLGLNPIGRFTGMPRSALRRRFGEELLLRLRQALGEEAEFIQPLQPVVAYEEQLPCLEPVCTAAGIEIAIERLLETLCKRLSGDGKGLRKAVLKCCRVDGKIMQVAIGTNQASANAGHLFRLFALKIPQIEPDLGIELFILQASRVEDTAPLQEALWAGRRGLESAALAELLDRLAGKAGSGAIRRYLPEEHYWPERSVRAVSSFREKPAIPWRTDKPRPIRLLARPEPVKVSAPIPDYPPMVFRYKGKMHQVRKADGPERIEREWWMDEGERRDYYQVEDEEGRRYWLFRSGQEAHDRPRKGQQWFIHGFFA